MELTGIRVRLASLWKEKVEIKKRLGKIDAEISKIQTQLDNEDVIKIVSNIIDDDKEFQEWFISRQKRLFEKERKQKARENISKGELNLIDDNSDLTYLYALYHKEEIVYIGITKNLKNRLYQHKRTTKIFDRHQVLSIFNNRFYALKEENNLIIEHKPKYNKQTF
jgi:predicted GIY-YIG superfamily endonuclease